VACRLIVEKRDMVKYDFTIKERDAVSRAHCRLVVNWRIRISLIDLIHILINVFSELALTISCASVIYSAFSKASRSKYIYGSIEYG